MGPRIYIYGRCRGNRADYRADLDTGLEALRQEINIVDWSFLANQIPLSQKKKRIIMSAVWMGNLPVYRKRECLLKAFDGLC